MNLNTSLLICETCRLHSLKVRAPETMEQSVAEDFQRDEHLSAASILHQQPSSSRQPLKEVPSAASFISTSSQDTIDNTYSRTHNIELFNRGVAGISVSPISTKKMRKTQYPQKSIWKSLKACGITFSVSEQKTILSWWSPKQLTSMKLFLNRKRNLPNHHVPETINCEYNRFCQNPGQAKELLMSLVQTSTSCHRYSTTYLWCKFYLIKYFKTISQTRGLSKDQGI